MTLLDTLVTKLQESFQNQFLSGGLVLMIVGAALALLRSLPSKLWDWLVRQVTVSMTIRSSDPLWDCMQAWLSASNYAKRSRRLVVSALQLEATSQTYRASDIFYTPAAGKHLFWYRRRPGIVDRDIVPNSNMMSNKLLETVTLKFLGRDTSIVRAIIGEALAVSHAHRQSQVKAYLSTHSWWNFVPGFTPRPIDSVILDYGQKEAVIRDVEQFIGNREWYARLGVPYHRGYLLEGPPGSGKTSLVSALAGHVQMPLYVLNLAGPTINDDELITLIAALPSNSILLIEDIDAAVASRDLGDAPSENSYPKMGVQTTTTPGPPVPEKKEKPGKVSLSALLNCLDGIGSKDQIIVFMSTNRPDALDPALTRPGRMDVRVRFGHATPFQLRKLYDRFRPNDPSGYQAYVGNWNGGVTMAEAQELLVQMHFDNQLKTVTNETIAKTCQN